MNLHYLQRPIDQITPQQARDRFFWHWDHCEQCQIACNKTHRHEDHCAEAQTIYARMLPTIR